MAVVAVADSTQHSEAECKNVTPDQEVLGSGEGELPMKHALPGQNMPVVLKGKTTIPPKTGLSELFRSSTH